MANATSSSIQSRFATLVRDRANNGISWGRNSTPRDTPSSYFGGTTSGLSAMPSLAAMENGDGSLNPDAVVNELLRVTRLYGRIRRTRVRIKDLIERRSCTRIRECGGGEGGCGPVYRRVCRTVESVGIVYDGTAIAHLPASNTAGMSAPHIGGLRSGTDAKWSEIEAYLDRLWVSLKGARGNTYSILYEACHSSCHVSTCYSSNSGGAENPGTGPGGANQGSGGSGGH